MVKNYLKKNRPRIVGKMKTFNFNFKCKYCISYNSRRNEILNHLFDGNITNNILSFTTCIFCHKMYEYEKEYDDTNKLSNYYKRVEHRQIHCILKHFDNGYKKLTSLIDKKNYLKDIIDKSKTELKPLLKKFLNERGKINMIDEYRMFWLLDYNIYYLYDKWDFEGETYEYRNKYKEPIWVIMVAIFNIYFQKQVGLYRKYFDFKAIYDYLCDIFGEED